MRELVIVTGGTKGIGRNILEKYAQEESNLELVTCSRNTDDLNGMKKEFASQYPGVILHTIKADLSERQEVNNFISFIKNLDANVSVLINNAGMFIPGKISEEEDGVLEKMINTNLYSAYHITRGVVDDMKSRGEGHIFNICSTASIIPYINGGSYCISKFALYGMTKVLREEMKEFGVRVTAVLPGATYTASWEGADLPEERFMKASDVADSIYQIWKLSGTTVVEEILLRPQLGDI